jgi:BlaI family transcriptional regulator, penicillinase repressor
MEKLTKQEEVAMIAVWKAGKGFVKDLLEHHEPPKPHYNTLSSTLKNLERKGYVKGKKYGIVIEYTPVIKEGVYKKKFMSGFVKDYFENSYKNLVTFFAKEKKISANELKEILNLIEEKKQKK